MRYLCMSIVALASLELALAATVASSTLAWGVCNADGCDANAGAGGPGHLAEDSALLQMGGIARATALDTSGHEAAVFDNVSDPNILALLQEEAEQLRWGRPTSMEMEHFNLVKAIRRKGFRCPGGKYFRPNFGEFKLDCRLWRAGRLWSKRMAHEDFVAHKHAGSTSCKRTNAQGFPRNRACGENIAAGAQTPQEALKQLKESDHHCLNMFEPTFNKLGVGYASNLHAKYRHYWTDSFGDWHYGPDQSCIGGSPAPHPKPGCEDIDTMNCQTYKAQGFCEYSPNVQAQCKDTCGIGRCGSGGHPVDNNCRDSDPNCGFYLSKGYCSMAHIKTTCKKSCGACGGGHDSCADSDSHCAAYRSLGYCTDSKVKAVCRRSCGLCR